MQGLCQMMNGRRKPLDYSLEAHLGTVCLRGSTDCARLASCPWTPTVSFWASTTLGTPIVLAPEESHLLIHLTTSPRCPEESLIKSKMVTQKC